MDNTIYYNFMPSKAEEEESKANNAEHEVTGTLVEVNNSSIPRPINAEGENPRMITRSLRCIEAVFQRICLSNMEASTYILPYMTLDMANEVSLGNKVRVLLLDLTENNNPIRYSGESIYFKKLPDDRYVLYCKELFDDRKLLVNDEFGLSWDPVSSTFQFRLIRTALGARLHE